MRSPRNHRLSALLVTAALAVAAAPMTQPGYTTPDGEIHFLESQAWFAAGESTLANLDQEQDQWVRWVAAAPTDDTGAALMSAGPVSPIRERTHGRDAEYKTQFTAIGTHTGHLDSLTLDLHFVQPLGPVPCDADTDVEVELGVDLEIDGTRIIDMADNDGYSSYVPVTVEETEAGHVARLKIVNLHDALVAEGISGDDDTVHDVWFSVQQFYLCEEVVWRYDSTATPSSILFNRHPDDPSIAGHTTIDATRPPEGDPPTLRAPELPDLP